MLLASIGIPPLLTIIVALGLFLPYLAVTIRRLHDTNRSGWWILIGFIPLVGLIVMLIFLCTKGTDGSNDFGPDPFKGDLAEQF